VIDILKDTLAKVNEWIKFAEAENAANIAFCSASVFAITRTVSTSDGINSFIAGYLAFVVLFLMIALLISLMSFVPKLQPPWLHINERKKDDNFLFFGHACKYNASSYLDLAYSGKKHKSENYDIEVAYSSQIVINSKIAHIKFKQFEIAIWFTVAAIATPIGAILLWLLKE